MARFFFHIHDSASLYDEEGTELPDLRSACDQAIEAAGSMLRENPDSLWKGTPWRMEVTDERSQLLFTLDFALRQAKPEG